MGQPELNCQRKKKKLLGAQRNILNSKISNNDLISWASQIRSHFLLVCLPSGHHSMGTLSVCLRVDSQLNAAQICFMTFDSFTIKCYNFTKLHAHICDSEIAVCMHSMYTITKHPDGGPKGHPTASFLCFMASSKNITRRML